MLLLSTLLTLLMPVAEPVASPPEHGTVARQMEPGGDRSSAGRRTSVWNDFVDAAQPPVVRQVRIERRVIVRISPQSGRVRRDLASGLPQRGTSRRLIERPVGDCISTNGIVGVSDRGSRLVMYMRDRSMISAELEKACSPRDFYLGFYLERNADGQLCVGRDKLMSRAGARCHVRQMRKLEYVTVDD